MGRFDCQDIQYQGGNASYSFPPEFAIVLHNTANVSNAAIVKYVIGYCSVENNNIIPDLFKLAMRVTV